MKRRPPAGRGAAALLAVVLVCAVLGPVTPVAGTPPDRPAGRADLLRVPAAARAAAPVGSLVVSSPHDPGVRLRPRQPQRSAPLLAVAETVTLDAGSAGQRWTGVGAALTDASVAHLEGRPDLVRLLFDPASERGARLQWLRLPLSATDFSTSTWGWRQRRGTVVPSPQARRTLRFLRDEVLPVNPDLRLVATPWSAPPRFKEQATWFGSRLRDDAVRPYAAMLVGQVRWLREHRFPVRALTLANEPGLAADYPTMLVSDRQLRRLATRVGPRVARLGVDLWALDHNWSDVGRARRALRGAPGTYGAVAFHCYAGVPAQAAGLDVPWVLDECTGTDDSAVGTLDFDSRVLVDQSVAAGSTGLMFFNLALTPGERGAFGGCGTCRGLLTLVGAGHRPEPEHYVLAHLSRAARRGSTVLDVAAPTDVVAAAFRRPDGSVGVYGYNRRGLDRYLRFGVSGTGAPSSTGGQLFRVGANEVFTWTLPAR